jgi:hypothetical protein
MWVFTLLGSFSIVAHRDRPGSVLVRARVEADLAAFVKGLPDPRPKIRRTPDADYLFRVVARKQHVADLLASYVADGIDYDNFKDAVAEAQGVPRAKVYHDVWRALLPLQHPPKLALVKSTKPKPKRGHGGVTFGTISGAELDAIERAKAQRASEQRIAAMPPALVDLFTSEDCLPTVAEQSIEPDASMMLEDFDSEEEAFAAMKTRINPQTFARLNDKSPTDPDPNEIKTEAEWEALLRARAAERKPPVYLGDLFDHDGSDIQGFDKDGKEI